MQSNIRKLTDAVEAAIVQRQPALCSLLAENQLIGAAVLEMNSAEIAQLIDHTLLKPDATASQIERLCDEALQHGFISVCINPTFLPEAAEKLAGSAVKLCTVIGFPLGANGTAVKSAETEQAIAAGATEVDMVMPVGRLKAQQYQAVYDDIASVVTTAHPHDVLVKVIIETALLSDDEKIAASHIAKLAGADFVKTSTGFAAHGAKAADVALMRTVVGPHVGVKASGGVRSRADLEKMVQMGANRIGASSGVSIVTG